MQTRGSFCGPLSTSTTRCAHADLVGDMMPALCGFVICLSMASRCFGEARIGGTATGGSVPVGIKQVADWQA